MDIIYDFTYYILKDIKSFNISKGKPVANSTKVWLTKAGGCIVSNNNSKIPEKDLNEILEVISNNCFFIVSIWKKHFPSFELKFYC